MNPEERDVVLGTGRLYARRWGPDAGAPPVVCIPGLSANARSFDRIGEALAAAGRHVLALDLRGRGRSEVTAPGTYGWDAHARDVLDAARSLGAERADLVGHSM